MNILKRTGLIVALGLSFLSLPSQALEGVFTEQKAQIVPGVIIVKMKPQMSLQSTVLSTFGLQTVERVTSGGEIIYRIAPSVMGAMAETEVVDRTLQIVDELKKRPDVEYAQPDYILHYMQTPNDPLYARQWHYFNFGTGAGESPGGIDLPKAWDKGTGSRDVVVAVIDTGILPDHPDIIGSNNLVSGYDMVSDTTRANDGDARDNDPTDPGDAIAQGECGGGQPSRDIPNSWHGTHVAGTIGVVNTNNNKGVAGINWKVSVQAIRVLGKCGGSTSDINDAIRWAAGLSVPGVPNNPHPAKVINMSLGGGPAFLPCPQASPSTQSAIDDAVAQGVTVVVAAGNSGDDAARYIPAGCNNVITVAASDPQGTLTSFSNHGNTVEIMAPGGLHEGCSKPQDGILSTVGNDHTSACVVDTDYEYYNGTSMAAPHVAGVAALWLSQDPSLTPQTLLTELQNSARPRNSTQCPKPCGAGLLSALRGAPGVSVSLVFDPAKSSYPPGETFKARATVKLAGTPQAGKTVQFSSANSSIASVSTASATTNASGQAETTVTANAAGDTTITAQAEGVSANKQVSVGQVPDLSRWGIFALLTVVIALSLMQRRAGSA